MFFKKEGKPEPKELVVCTVKKILPHAAFVYLDEYNNLEAMLHVSEISSKWIKNIKDHISEGKRIVCKVMDIKHRDHIDVSLKRVRSSETKRKLNELKSEQRTEKLIEAIPPTAGKAGIDLQGNPAPSKPGQKAAFPFGPGVKEIEEEGIRFLVADHDGIIKYTRNSIEVAQSYEVKGDVDFNTGNIEYSGSVFIHGDVKSGFVIKEST